MSDMIPVKSGGGWCRVVDHLAVVARKQGEIDALKQQLEEARKPLTDEETRKLWKNWENMPLRKAVALLLASRTTPVAPDPCPDCAEAARHAYSDATTPGFFSPRCSKHPEPVETGGCAPPVYAKQLSTSPEEFKEALAAFEHEVEQPAEAAQDDYIAWIRYEHYDEQPTRIMLCDSDEEGAFKVYRHPVIAREGYVPASEAYTVEQIRKALNIELLNWHGTVNECAVVFTDRVLARLTHPKGEQRG